MEILSFGNFWENNMMGFQDSSIPSVDLKKNRSRLPGTMLEWVTHAPDTGHRSPRSAMWKACLCHICTSPWWRGLSWYAGTIILPKIHFSFHFKNHFSNDRTHGQIVWFPIDGLVQGCSNSSALAMELLQSCTKPLVWLLTRIIGKIKINLGKRKICTTKPLI